MKHSDILKLSPEEAKKTIALMSDLDRALWIADRDGLDVYYISCRVAGITGDKSLLISYTAARNITDALRSARCKWLLRANSPQYYNYFAAKVEENLANYKGAK